jgi:uncharacterized C2H2 Zn-finger protein
MSSNENDDPRPDEHDLRNMTTKITRSLSLSSTDSYVVVFTPTSTPPRSPSPTCATGVSDATLIAPSANHQKLGESFSSSLIVEPIPPREPPKYDDYLKDLPEKPMAKTEVETDINEQKEPFITEKNFSVASDVLEATSLVGLEKASQEAMQKPAHPPMPIADILEDFDFDAFLHDNEEVPLAGPPDMSSISPLTSRLTFVASTDLHDATSSRLSLPGETKPEVNSSLSSSILASPSDLSCTNVVSGNTVSRDDLIQFSNEPENKGKPLRLSDLAQYLKTCKLREDAQNDAETETSFSDELAKYVDKEGKDRFRCQVPGCRKLFKGEQFWKKHMVGKHQSIVDDIEKEEISLPDGMTDLVTQEGEDRFRCLADQCHELFKAEHFWKRHMLSKHQSLFEAINNEVR